MEGEIIMYKEYMLKCEGWNPLDCTWNKTELFFDTEEEVREYVKSQGNGIRVEVMFKLTKIEW